MRKRYTVKLEPLGRRIETEEGVPLRDILHPLGFEFPCGGRGTCGNCKVKMPEGNIALDDEHRKALERHRLPADFRLACMSRVTANVTLEAEQWEAIILADSTPFDFQPEEGCGIAVDVGTTTIVAQLLHLKTAQVLGVKTALNPQTKYGADLMSRIQYALDGGFNELRDMLRESIGRMIAGLRKKSPAPLTKITLTGNTVMHHLFSGLSVESLAFYPFESDYKDLQSTTTEALGWNIPENAPVHFLPCIGGFVGSDILAGIMAAAVHKSDSFIALIDMGTNGEICIGNKEKILCASTAAGPAFEGTNISMGMRAVTGAISEVEWNGEKYDCHIINGGEPRGICGSGLIGAAAAALNSGALSPDGTLNNEEGTLKLIHPVAVSQKDIRELQLAKGAIQAGMQILMKHLAITYEDISDFYIAGAFGNSLNYKNTSRLGLFPFPEEKITKLGNSSLIGAKMALFANADEQISTILKKTNTIPLEKEPGFQDIFVGNMFFGL